MKIALINGSPKIKKSASNDILKALTNCLESDQSIISQHHFNKPVLEKKEMEKLAKCDAFVFAFPLYVDGVPSHLLSCLIQLEEFLANKSEKDMTVYVFVNSGFPEGEQNGVAIEIMENWCAKTGLKWGQGMGIGAGGMILSVKGVPCGHGPKKNLGRALENMASNILQKKSEPNMFTTMNMPKFAYRFAAHMNWRISARANGLTKKDLFSTK